MRYFFELLGRHGVVVAFFWLALLEVMVFGNLTKFSGFYLDDWSMLKIFHFGPSDFIDMTKNYLLTWSLITLRPVQAPFHAALYSAFGLHPFGYHFVMAAMDIVSAQFFYLIVVAVFKRKDVAMIAASLALVDPRHDTTHNWVLCSSVALSQILTMFSIWLAVIGVQRNSKSLKLWSLVPYALMVWNYEMFLPIAVLNAFVLGQSEKSSKFFRRFIVWGLYYSIPVVLLLAFHKFWLPLLIKPTIHEVVFDLKQIFFTIYDGFMLQLGPATISYFIEQLTLNWSDLPTRIHVLSCAAILALVLLLVRFSGDRAELPTKPLFHICFAGLAVIFLSYVIFGLNKEYQPALASIYNRVNTGGTWGGALIVAAVLVASIQHIGCTRALREVLLALAFASGLIFYAGVDWCFERPWIVSWQTQQNIKSVLVEVKGQLRDGDSVILLNCPRYVSWTPVFDGVWDFDRMVQIVTNNQRIGGNVVSERLSLTKTTLTDTAHGFMAGDYAIASTYFLLPDHRKVLKIQDANQFVDEVERNGMKYGLDPAMPNLWRRQLLRLPNEGRSNGLGPEVHQNVILKSLDN